VTREYRDYQGNPIDEREFNRLWRDGWQIVQGGPDGLRVSTMWDGSDREEGPFETCVFGTGEDDLPTYHWANEAAARAGHEKVARQWIKIDRERLAATIFKAEEPNAASKGDPIFGSCYDAADAVIAAGWRLTRWSGYGG
jgi:hypothetical protein